MNRVRTYLNRLRTSVFHRGEAFALEGGIFFGPGSDPKGSFYSHPKLSIYWYQPGSVTAVDELERDEGLFKNWLSKLSRIKKSA